MSEDNRRPVLIAVVCAVVAILVLGAGIGFGGHRSDGAKGWQDSLSGFGRATALVPADLRLTLGTCAVSGQVITVHGVCTFTVDKFGGSFDLGPPTKQATLTAIDAPVQLALQVEGTAVSQNLKAGDHVKLTFGKSGGSLTVLCAALACVVSLT